MSKLKFTFFFIFTSLISAAFADVFQSTSQYSNIKQYNQHKNGFFQEILARTTLSRKLDIGIQGSYLERFDLFEKTAGVNLNHTFNDFWTIDFTYLMGHGNKILPEIQSNINLYHRYSEGISPFVFIRQSAYSLTNVTSLSLGTEIEKIPHLIFIPTLGIGKATFKTPAITNDINNFGLKIIYYTENKYAFSIFASVGKEASQAVIGANSRLIDTQLTGLSIAYYIISQLKTEIILDNTKYQQLDTNFQNSTLNLTWML